MANLAPTQVEQLQSIGAYLRQVRQEQGLSLEVVANQIFIRPALLQALETGHPDQLPEPVFIQGFIRRYAEALGLDGKAISQEFWVTPAEVLPTPELVTPADANGGPPPQRPQPEAARPVRVVETALPSPSRRRQGRLGLWPWLVALGAVALGVGLWALLNRNPAPNGRMPQPTPTEPTPAVPETLTPDALEPIEPTPAASAEQEAPIVVKATLSDRAWVSVVADGETIYEGTLNSGTEETWTAQDSLVVRTGNAGGISLGINGDTPEVLGESGVVKTLNLTPESGAEAITTP